MAGIMENIGFNDQMTPVLTSIIRDLALTQNATNEVNNTFGRWNGTLMGIDSALNLIQRGMQTISGMTGFLDEQVLIGARIGLINDGLRTQAELQQQIYQSAQRSRGAYSETADMVARIGILAEDAFANNDEMILFAENINKSFKLSGSNAAGMSGAIIQLTQGLAAGALRGEELNSVLENGGLIAQYIADYLEVPKGQLKEIASEGGLTADIIKNAIFAATDDINSKFAEVPKTFGDIQTQMSNTAAMAFQPAVEAFNGLIDSPAFGSFMQTVTSGIYLASAATTELINGISFLFGVMDANMPYIIAILAGLTAYYLPTMIMQTLSMAAAWLAVNWPVLLVIGSVMLLVYALGEMGVTFNDVIEMVGGSFGVLYTLLQNSIAYMWNGMASLAEFFANVFIDPVESINRLFLQMADNILAIIVNVAEAIDLVFGSGMAGAVEGMRNSISAWSMTHYGEATIKVPRMDYVGYEDGINLGIDTANNLVGGIGSVLDGIGGMMDQGYGGFGNMGGLNLDGVDIGSVGKIKDKVEISSEDLKSLKEFAEMQYINQFTTVAPNPQINIQFGDVRETVDLNQLDGRIAEIILNEIAVSMEGIPV